MRRWRGSWTGKNRNNESIHAVVAGCTPRIFNFNWRTPIPLHYNNKLDK